MAFTLTQLQTERDQIITAMGQPARVAFEGREVQQKPQADLEAALRRVDAEIAALQSPQSRQFTIQTNRGI